MKTKNTMSAQLTNNTQAVTAPATRTELRLNSTARRDYDNWWATTDGTELATPYDELDACRGPRFDNYPQ